MVRMFKPHVEEGIMRASKETGVPYEVLKQFANMESGGNENEGAPRSFVGKNTVKGLYQYSHDTGKAYGLVGPGFDNRTDPYISSVAAAKSIKDYGETLGKHGLEPTPFNMYMLHYFGEAGGPDILKAYQAGDDHFNKNYGGLTMDGMIRNNYGGKNPGVMHFMNETKNRFDNSWKDVAGDKPSGTEWMAHVGNIKVPDGHFGQSFEVPGLEGATIPIVAGLGAAAGGLLGSKATATNKNNRTMNTIGGTLGGGAMALGMSGALNKMAALKDDVELQEHQERVRRRL